MCTNLAWILGLFGFCALILLNAFPLAFGFTSLDLNRGDNLAIEYTLRNESDGTSQEFVHIVQVEDEQGIVVFLSFQNGVLFPDGEQEITINWSSENEGKYAIRTFVWSALDNPVPLTFLSSEPRIAVNGEDMPVCTGSEDCITGIVTKVIDGDTLDVGDIRIRLTLVNSPEIDEEGYDEAKAFTSTLCPVGSHVLVDEDDGQPEGSFGRMIAKVTCGENKILNAELLDNGHANLLTEFCAESEFATEDWVHEFGCTDETQDQIPASNLAPSADTGTSQTVNEGTVVTLDGRKSSDPDGNKLSYSWKQIGGPSVTLRNDNTATPYFTAPSVDAQTTLVFSLALTDGEQTSTASVNVVVNNTPVDTQPPAAEETDCDSSYPAVCIPPPPPDLDCGDISYQNFKVLSPDPHRFDGDNDGIGCES